jgi:SSS family solute:Na+ symporter
LPFRKKPFARNAHLWSLRFSIVGVAIFACTFSLLFKAVDYLAMTIVLIGSIYLAGIGAITLGALYWRKATNAGAWAALTASLVLGVAFNLLQQTWPHFSQSLVSILGSGTLGDYVLANVAKFPFSGQQLAFTSVIAAAVSFVSVSLLTYREDFNLDRMLHRGQYRISSDDSVPTQRSAIRNLFRRFLQIDEHCTPGDTFLITITFAWSVFWKVVNVAIILWILIAGPLSQKWWFHYMMITNVWMTLVLGVIVTVWFYFGVSRDFVELFRSLSRARLVEADDGTVRDHKNLGES